MYDQFLDVIIENIKRWCRRFSRTKREDVYPLIPPYENRARIRRRRSIPDRIGRIYLPLDVIEKTDTVMRRFGLENRECYVWWGGYFAHGEGQVVTAIWPECATEYGHIHLTNPQLQALNEQLRRNDQVLLVELHTHPGASGQNAVDAQNPATTYPGFISIVVPNFAFPNLWDLRDTHVYEYISDNQWRTLSRNEIQRKFVIEKQAYGLEV